MIKKFHLTKNDLQPYYPVTVKDALGAVVDLTGATIVCTMRLEGGTTPKINRQNAGINITDAANGQFEYRWQSGDTDAAASIDPATGEPTPYNIEFEIDPATGGKFTMPNRAQGTAQVLIWDSLDSV